MPIIENQLGKTISFTTFGNSVQEFYLRAIRNNARKREEKLASLKTREDAEAYVADVRKKVKSIFQFPAEKCPLNMQITGEIDHPCATIKKVLFHSRENYTVTASLCYPKQLQEKNPAVLFLCGHSETGKAADAYQISARQLALRGFIVLALDPVGQGERHQFPRNIVPMNCCLEHNILGKQMLLNGDWFGNWRTWDGIRGIDLLLSLPEVDPARIGIMGTSGGGTMTTLISAADDRLAWSTPSCYITSWRRNVENEIPADIEQMPPRAIEMGLEMVDLLVAGAPRPRMIIGEKNDFFDARGTKEAYEELKALYALLGREDDIELFIGPGSHSLSIFLRQAAYDFHCRHAGIKNCAPIEEDPGLLPESELYATPTGSVLDLPGEKPAHELIVEEMKRLKAARKPLSKEEVRAILKEKLNLGEIKVPRWRALRFFGLNIDDMNYFGGPNNNRFGLETEEDLVMSVLYRRADGMIYHIEDAKSIELYIPHLDSKTELGFCVERKGQRALYALDYRGVGECTPTSCTPMLDFFAQYEFDFHYTCLGEMTGLNYLGGRVKDILSAVELLSQHCPEIHLTAKGQGGIPALIAAVLSDKIQSIKLIDMPESWESAVLAQIPEKETSARAIMVNGAMKYFDLEDLKKLVVIAE